MEEHHVGAPWRTLGNSRLLEHVVESVKTFDNPIASQRARRLHIERNTDRRKAQSFREPVGVEGVRKVGLVGKNEERLEVFQLFFA